LEDHYTDIKFHFMGIENIHVMRASLAKLLEVCQTKNLSSSDFITGLENSGWLKHIKAVMDTAVFIAKAVVSERVSVLAHCSDGWDRTAQVSSLASLLIDPFYRSTRGFMVLVEKEWISFGHKFSHRCAHLEGEGKEASPVFVQFLECVWQLGEQFPQALEFNDRLLLQLHDHVHSCQFGNFLGNSQRERRQLRIEERTHSLWAHLWEQRASFTNPLYRPELTALRPDTSPCLFKFWRGMYNRFETGMHPRQSVSETLTTLTTLTSSLQQEVEHLEQVTCSRRWSS
ncbi:phosphatidylinositol-3,5-bisphosphate 3-phosphatase MTMR8-like, partial [Lampetra fluviatilis]